MTSPASNSMVNCVFPGITNRIMVILYVLDNLKDTSLLNDSSNNDLLLDMVESIDLYRTGTGLA